MKKNNFFVKIITAVLLLVLICALLATVIFASGQNDYSKPGVTKKETLTPDAILSAIIGEPLSEAETEYLKLYSDFKIEYGSHIPANVVAIGRDELTGDFTVKASTYSYITESGIEVTFIPVKATVLEKVVTFTQISDNEFTADFDASYYDENGKVQVLYETKIEISREQVNSLINKGYYDAADWKTLISEENRKYEEALVQYERDSALYEEYVAAAAEYEVLKAAYDKYVREKAVYDRKLRLYNEYRSELSSYEADLVEYQKYEQALKRYNEDYSAYQKYLKYKDNFGEMLAKYETYVRDIAIVREQLAILDGTKNKSTSLERSVYSAVIIGTTVTEVIENKDAIANDTVGVKGEVVDQAGLATENLRRLCKAYFKIEGEAEKYAFYLLNYEELRSNFVSLFTALDKMYKNPKVQVALKEKGIQEKYEILLAQLFYVVNAINDGPVYNYDNNAIYDSSYVIKSSKTRTPLAILDNVPYMTDTENAKPLTTGYPTEVEQPVLVEMTEPKKPSFVSKPIAPDAVEDPGEPPVEVSEPKAPPYVADPGEAPEPYVADPAVLALIDSVDKGELAKRNEVLSAQNLSIGIDVYKQLGNVEFFEVKFLDESGNPLCNPVLVDKGTYADYSGPIPYKPEDEMATYEFVGWVNEEGTACDITSVESNLVLYPQFEKHLKTYTVTWKIDGNLKKVPYTYGETPIPPADPQKEEGETFEYVFEGWDKEIVEVTEEVVYTAVFKSEPICTLSTGTAIQFRKNEEGFVVTSVNTKDKYVNLTKLMARLDVNETITLTTNGYDLVLQPETAEEMKSIGAVGVCLEVSEPGISEHKMQLLFLDKDGNVISQNENQYSQNLKVTVNLSLDYEDGENVSLYYLNGEDRVPVRSSYKSKTLTATCVAGRKYHAVVEYAIDIINTEMGKIIVPSTAKKGESVKVAVSDLPLGAVVDMLYYIDENGIKNPINDGEFIMKSGSVSVGMQCHVPTYLITFMADGKVVYIAELEYGKTLTVPAVPAKPSDDGHSYTDGVWFPEVVTTVTEDAVYEAKYTANELPKTEAPLGTVLYSGLTVGDNVLIPPITLTITPSNVNTAAKILILAFYAFIVVLPLTLIVIVKAIKRVRR